MDFLQDPRVSSGYTGVGLESLPVKHMVHGDIMGFLERVRYDLERVTDADFQGIGTDVREHPVIIPASASQTSAVQVERKSRADESIDLSNRNLSGASSWFENAMETGLQTFTAMKRQGIAADSRENP